MIWKSTFAAALLAAACGLVPQARAACDPGTKIDGTTAGQAREKIERAGYSKVHALNKGCDNVWHASAEKDGTPTMLALAPDGHVYPERE